LFIFGLAVGTPVLIEFYKTSYISKLPSAVLSVGFMILSVLSLFSGFILDTIVKQHREDYELSLTRWIEQERVNRR